MPQDMTLEDAARLGFKVDVCQECAVLFNKTRKDKIFCSNLCRKNWHCRAAARGAQIYAAAMDWRLSRGKRKFGDVTALLDTWIPEDRERKRRYEDAKKKITEVTK